jgi:hypothetical protein
VSLAYTFLAPADTSTSFFDDPTPSHLPTYWMPFLFLFECPYMLLKVETQSAAVSIHNTPTPLHSHCEPPHLPAACRSCPGGALMSASKAQSLASHTTM